MAGVLYKYLAEDHDRLEQLLESATADPDAFDMKSDAEFRKGLLRHIGIEEKIIVPRIAKAGDERSKAIAARLRSDHGAIVALLVPPPSSSVVATLRTILDAHNIFEEQEGGFYEILDEAEQADPTTVLEMMRSAPEVPVLPHNANPEVLTVTRRAVERAGYQFKETPEAGCERGLSPGV